MVEPVSDEEPIESAEPVLRLTLNVKETAAALGISQRLLWSLTFSHAVPHVKVGRRTLYPIRELENWLGLLAVDSVNPESPTVHLLVDRTKASLARSRENLRELLMHGDAVRGAPARSRRSEKV